ncbi:hypothetical protein Hanom_Chr00s002904g01706761 [Helianthus anomalus]
MLRSLPNTVLKSISSSSSSYSVNHTNSKAMVGSEEGTCRQPYLYAVGIERLLPLRPRLDCSFVSSLGPKTHNTQTIGTETDWCMYPVYFSYQCRHMMH